MGNSVTVSPLTIQIQNQPSQFPCQPLQTNISTRPQVIQFPFMLVSSLSNNTSTIQYRTQKQMQACTLPSLYKCDTQVFTTMIIQNTGARTDARIWRLIDQHESVNIDIGDQFRVGEIDVKVKFMVNQQINTRKYVQQQIQGQFQGKGVQSRVSNIKSQSYLNGDSISGHFKCRICFQGQYTKSKNNPLLSLCRCQGSVKYTHYQCLKSWQTNKIKKFEQPNCTIYQFLPIKCDICLKELPSHFWHEQQLLSIIEQENIQPPYAIFQAKSRVVAGTMNKNNQKIVIYRVKFNEGLNVTVGRSGDSDIPVRCSAVSRKHCLLYYTHKLLFLRDLQSKYGTFVYSKNAHFTFNLQKGLTLWIKSSKLKIKKQNESFLSCCKGFQSMEVKIIDDTDDKLTVETWDLLDFLD